MVAELFFLPRERFQFLLSCISNQGYQCIGPQLRDGAVLYDTFTSIDALPIGIRDTQKPGEYRVQQNGDQRFFAWANGPQALKPLFFAPEESMWRAHRSDNGFVVEGLLPEAKSIAVIGVRACDLAALKIQDRIFLQGDYIDPYYARRRESLLIVGVNCTHSASTCFCVSAGDGPKCNSGFDIALTELGDGFVVQIGSDVGAIILAELNLCHATSEQIAAANLAVEHAATSQTRSLPSGDLRQALFANLNHERWENVAERCLSCGNCTQVCPTCFCHAEVEIPALDGNSSIHTRQWDSCFSEGHGYIHGMQTRPEIIHRYRQWLTHKLGSWHDQFGTSGCVGCGRCMTWCPVGIDMVEEVNAICGGDLFWQSGEGAL